MALPKINHTIFETTLPLSNKTIKFRPYTVRDEKILLTASTTKDKDPRFYVDNVTQVIKNCIVEADVDFNSLTAVDVEYFLLQLRAKSVGEMVELKFTDPETGKTEVINLNLENFKVDVDESHQYKIELTDDVGLKMRDLRFIEKIQYAASYNDNNKAEIIYDTIVDCIESIYDADKVYVNGQDATRTEIKEFIESLSGKSKKLYDFVQTLPQLSIDIELANGKTRTFSGSDFDFLALSLAT